MKYCPECAAPLVPTPLEGRERLACSAACGYVFYDNPTPVVAAIVERDGHVLLVRNKGWPETWFGLVTGFLERGEAPEHGATREVAEELGLQSEVVGLVGVYPFLQMNQVLIAYHLRASGEVKLGAELEAFKPVLVEKLRPWPMGTGDAVRDWLAARTRAKSG